MRTFFHKAYEKYFKNKKVFKQKAKNTDDVITLH